MATAQQEASREVRKLQRLRHFEEWRLYEDLGTGGASSSTKTATPWRVSAQKALDELLQPLDSSLEAEVDISVDNVRVPTEEELVEEMIVKRLAAEAAAGESAALDGEAPEAKRHKASSSTQQPQVDLEEVAPIRKIDQIRSERNSRIRTKTAQLVVDSLTARATPPFLLAARTKPVVAYRSGVEDDPHEESVSRLLGRYTGVLRPKSYQRTAKVLHKGDSRLSDCKPADLTGIPEGTPRVDPKDVIVSVSVCSLQGHKEQEFDILASQSLEDLRDALWFVQDWSFDGPRRLKSACFFIDGIFYVDRRHASALDYSKELIELLKATRPDALRDTKSRSMSVKLCEMDRLPFGERCIYIHQGDLEHNVFFTGARLIGAGDCPLLEPYPILTFMRKYVKRNCYACMGKPAIWIVLDSTRTPHNPCFLCQMCFRHFYQDERGELIPPVDYKIFPYLHDE